MPLNPTIEQAMREALVLAPAAQEYVHTLEIRHASISEPLYLVQGFLHRDVTLETAEVVTCVATPFAFKLPPVNDTGLQELNITFDDINRRVSQFCRNAAQFTDPIEVIYRPYLAQDLTEPQLSPPLRMTLTNVQIEATQVSGRAITADFLNGKYPTIRYTTDRFPGLINV